MSKFTPLGSREWVRSPEMLRALANAQERHAMNPEETAIAGKRRYITVREHLWCDVTALVQELADAEADIGLVILHGDPESSQRAYEAHEIWAVSEWLAIKLKMREQRVERVGGQHYWARESDNPILCKDPVLAKIIASLT